MQVPFNTDDQPFSLYIHIPFCVKKCYYCDFYSVPFDSSLASQYIDALGREWEIMQQELSLQSRSVNTVYIGGGTPSLLDNELWGRLNTAIFSKLDLSELEEWSVECNPESFTIKKAFMYADTGVTRLTFGVQSLLPRELSVCGRVHTSRRALEVLGDPRLPEWFDSIGADLIYSLPGQTVESLDTTLSGVLSVPAVKHLSAYELTISPDTPFGRHSKRLPVPSEEHSVEMYELVGRRCRERGMHQYEISNYALRGHESVHNRAYWSHKPYLGLGCSAHSYFHPKRWSNRADVNEYITMLSSGTSPVDFEEIIGPLELAREMIFLGLRNVGGLDEAEFEEKTGMALAGGGRSDLLSEYIGSGLLEKRGKKWIPTPKGMLFAEMMARELM